MLRCKHCFRDFKTRRGLNQHLALSHTVRGTSVSLREPPSK